MKRSKKLLSLLLSLMLVCSLLSVSGLTALAEEPFELWIGGTQVTGDTTSGPGWSYDAASKTLTLTDANITVTNSTDIHEGGAIYADGSLTVVLSGSNKLCSGILLKNGDLAITGSGSLTIQSPDTNGIYVMDGDLSVSGGCTLTAEGIGDGIYTDGDISITGSTVTVSSNVTALTASNVTVKDSSLTVTSAGECGMYIGGKTTITGTSRVSAEGKEYAIYSDEGFSIGEGLVITEPEGGEVDGGKIKVAGADAKKVVIEPEPTYTVMVSVKPEGAGTAIATPTSGKKGAEITLSATANEGYTFKKWQVVSGGVTVTNNKFTLGKKNVEIQAVFEPITYTVSFDPNGGTGSMTQATVTYGESYTLPECGFTAPEGMEFDKWDAGKPGDQIDVTADLTLKAVWKPITYTVKFDPNGGTGSMTEATVTHGEPYTLPECGFTAPEGEEFDKWDAGKPGDQIDVTADMTLKAVWKPITYTVKFETNSGTTIPDQTVAYGKTAAKPADPTREGFTFDGWFADADLSVEFDFTAPIKADATVYAKWTELPTYTVVSGGGTTWTKGSSSAVTITVNRDPDNSACFSHFQDVQIDGKALTEGTDYEAAEGSTVITLKPAALQKLSAGSHTVTINFDDGKAETKITIKAGTSGGGSGRPKTGDESMLPWITMLILSGAGLGGMALVLKKTRYTDSH